MSRFLTRNEDGTYLEEIESIDVCKWRINEVCCNDKCPYLGDFPYPTEMCYDSCGGFFRCEYYEEEDGVIKNGNRRNNKG